MIFTSCILVADSSLVISDGGVLDKTILDWLSYFNVPESPCGLARTRR